MEKKGERQEAGQGGHFPVLKVELEFNNKLPGSGNGSMSNPFLPTASVYAHN